MRGREGWIFWSTHVFEGEIRSKVLNGILFEFLPAGPFQVHPHLRLLLQPADWGDARLDSGEEEVEVP
jgi:hypothetical protein